MTDNEINIIITENLFGETVETAKDTLIICKSEPEPTAEQIAHLMKFLRGEK